MHRRAAQLVLVSLLALLPLVYWQPLLESYEHPKVVLLEIGALLLLLIGLDALAIRPRTAGRRIASAVRSLGRDGLALGVLALTLSAAVSTLVGVSPRTSLLGAPRSWAGLIPLSACVVLFFAARFVVRDGGGARLLLVAPVMAAAGAALLGILETLGASPLGPIAPERDRLLVRAAGPLGNENYLGGYLAAVLPLATHFCVEAWREARSAIAAVWAGAAALILGALVASFSRGPWLAATTAMTAFAVTSWRAGDRRGARRVLALGLAGALGLAAAAGATGVLGDVAEKARLRLSQRTEREVRPHIWLAAWRVFLDHPLLGVGPDAFGLVFPRYAPAEAWALERDATAARAHDELLHVAATQGALGLSALGAALAGLIAAGRRALRRAQSLPERTLVLAVAAGLLAYAVHGLFGGIVAALGALVAVGAGVLAGLARASPEPPGEGDEARADAIGADALASALGVCVGAGVTVLLVSSVSEHVVAYVAALAGVLGAVAWAATRTVASTGGVNAGFASPAPAGNGPHGAAGLIRAGAHALGLLLVGGLLAAPLTHSHVARRGADLLEAGRPRMALVHFDEVVARAPEDPLAWQWWASAHYELGRRARRPEARRTGFEHALEGFRRASRLEPLDVYARANQARALTELAALDPSAGRADAVFREYDGLTEQAPGQVQFGYDAAQAALALGAPKRAEGYARRTLAELPDFAPSRVQLGLAALARGDVAEAERELEAALAGRWLGHDQAEVRARAALAEVRGARRGPEPFGP